ncbi:MAG: hypothetical protein ABIH23_20655 [bacterium]
MNIWPIDLFQENIEDNTNPLYQYALKTIHWEPHGGYTDAGTVASLIENEPTLVGYNVSLGPSRQGGGYYDISNGMMSLGRIIRDVPGDPIGDYKFPPGNF